MGRYDTLFERIRRSEYYRYEEIEAEVGGRAYRTVAKMGLPDWQARRLLEQAARQNPARLQRGLEHILAADESIKTGRCSDREAMDILLANLAEDIKG